MKKLRLQLEQLRVETFETETDAASRSGTVRGHVEVGTDTGEDGDTDAVTIAKSCYGTHCPPTCNHNTCNASCNGSCATCNGTCHPDRTCAASIPYVCCYEAF